MTDKQKQIMKVMRTGKWMLRGEIAKAAGVSVGCVNTFITANPAFERRVYRYVGYQYRLKTTDIVKLG